MNNETIACEINHIRSFKYERLCKYLKEKYGEVNGPYFINENCKTKNEKIKRTNEGLFIHHIYENKAIMLSHAEYAVQFPFEWQEGENLVYCNYFEHVLLHVAIVKEYLKIESKKTKMAVGIGGLFNYMVPEIIDYINGYEYSRDYMKKALSIIDGNELLFIGILDNLRNYIFNDHEVFSIFYGTFKGEDKHRKMFDSFKCGKMIKKGKFNNLLFSYDVFKKRYKLIDSVSFVSMVEKTLGMPGYDYSIDIRPRGEYNYLGFDYYNRSGSITHKEYAILSTDIINLEDLNKKHFRKLVYSSTRHMLIKKNSTVSYKEIKNTKNVNKRYCLTVDGIIISHIKFTKEQAAEIVNKNNETIEQA